MELTDKIYVAGQQGLVGSAIVRKLRSLGYRHLILKNRLELDLLDQNEVHRFFETERPQFVFLCAAKVGGIKANSEFQADFLYENLVIATNTLHAAAAFGVEKLLFLGSSCIYPREAPQPISEEALLTGPLEPTNEGYALAKIAGLKLCEMYQRQYGKNFISAMPTNLYGPNDNDDPEKSHVIPGLLRKFMEAKKKGETSVTIWGTGTPLRDFLHVDDLADALHLLMQKYEGVQPINIGSGREISIQALAHQIAEVSGFQGRIVFDPSKPDGTPRKTLDIKRIRAMGWEPKIALKEGLAAVYQSLI